MLIISYGIVLVLCFITNTEFIGISFDTSGATTGDLSTPFILTLGAGVARTISKRHTTDEQFGIIGLASVGPLIAFLLFGFIKGHFFPVDESTLNVVTQSSDSFIKVLTDNLLACFLALIPVVIIFLVYNFLYIKLSKRRILSLLISSFIVYIGLLIFLSGIDYGFTMAGRHFANSFLNNGVNNSIFFGSVTVEGTWFKWLLIPLCFILCFIITLCEPSITVLSKQVDEMTNGFISSRVLTFFLATGIGLAGLLCILNILLEISILWFIVPLYLITIVLTIFSDNLFIGIAYDSGGVTGGAITSAFLVPMCLATVEYLSKDMQNQGSYVLSNGFGIIGYMSVTPIILVLILGMIYNIKVKKSKTSKINISEVLREE
jgi:hypothetical protein